MKEVFFSLVSVAIILSSCGGGKVDACECANEIQSQSNNAPNYEKCQEARRDSAFEAEFLKCTAALVMHKDTSEISMKNDKPVLQAPVDGSYTVELGKKIIWRGQKATGKYHEGTINIKSGSLVVTNGQISAGEVTLDMTSLVDTDLEDANSRAKLEGHLKSDDFFGVDKFPEATLVLKSVTNAGSTSVLNGDLTVKGKTEPVSVNALVSRSGDSSVVCSGGFQFDRSKHDVKYGSGTFFDNLGDDMIENMITITFSFNAQKQ